MIGDALRPASGDCRRRDAVQGAEDSPTGPM